MRCYIIIGKLNLNCGRGYYHIPQLGEHIWIPKDWKGNMEVDFDTKLPDGPMVQGQVEKVVHNFLQKEILIYCKVVY